MPYQWQNEGGFSPQIHLIENSDDAIGAILEAERAHRASAVLRFLDVGGRRGERRGFAAGMRYTSIDIEPKGDDVLVGDICQCPEIPDASFDVVASFEVFEHLREPWRAAEECVRILAPGGLLVHRAPFAYRYHPCPHDLWRFSAQGLACLFERTGEIEEVLLSGYDLRRRRWDSTKTVPYRWENGLDVPPVDAMGGFIENWDTVFVGRKKRRETPSAFRRKLLKLIRDPRRFFTDAAKKRGR